MKYDLVIWDFDGTLADTLAVALRIYNEAAARHGFLPIDDPEAVRRMSSLAFLREHKVPLLRLPLLMREFLAALKQEVAKVRLFPEIPETLAAVRGLGCRMGILSSNSRDNILACLEANGVADSFEFVVGYMRLLGKGRALRRLLRDRRVEPQRVLYVGDELRDLEAAREARTDVAAVSWGLHAGEFLAEQGPTYLVSAPSEIPSLLGASRKNQERGEPGA